MFKRIINYKDKACADGDLEKQRTELTPHTFFRCGYVDHLIDEYPKPPKDNKKGLKWVSFNEMGNRALQKDSENDDNDNYQKIYMHLWHKFLVMTKVLVGEFSIRDFGDSLQLTNWVLYSGSTCHMTPQVSYFIPRLLEDTDKYIEVADGHHFTAKQKGQVKIKCATITEILSSRHCTTYFWHQIYAIVYFQSLH